MPGYNSKPNMIGHMDICIANTGDTITYHRDHLESIMILKLCDDVMHTSPTRVRCEARMAQW